MDNFLRIPKSAATATSANNTTDWQLVYANDLHNQLQPPKLSYPFHHYLQEVKKQSMAQRDTLLLIGGDDHTGGMWDVFFEQPELPDPAYLLHQAAGVDAIALGNHDFDLGVEALSNKLAQHPELPVIATNLAPHSLLTKKTTRAIIFEFPRVKIGVMALMTVDYCPAPHHLIRPQSALAAYYPLLKKNCDFVIILSHLGYCAQDPTAFNDSDILQHIAHDRQTLLCGAHTHDTIPPAQTLPTTGHYLQSSSLGKCIGQATWNTQSQNFHLKNQFTQELSITTDTSPVTDCYHSLNTALKNIQNNWKPIQLSNITELSKENLGSEAYRGESPHLNFLNDFQAPPVIKSTQATVSALCVRALGTQPLKAATQLVDWYQVLPYLDRPDFIDIPWSQLPRFIEANAQRLLFPAHFLIDRGWLQFDRRLRYSVLQTEKKVSLKTLSYAGLPYDPNAYETLRIHSTTYFTLGFGGYTQLLQACDLSPNLSIRSSVNRPWKTVIAEKLQAASPLTIKHPLKDGRITLEH